MNVRLTATIAGFAFVASSVPMLAHHSVLAEYDNKTIVTIKGMVATVEWMNPHADILVDAKNDDGTFSEWKLELSPPNVLVRTGVKKDFVKQGDQVTVDLWRAKDGSKLGHALTLTLPDGRTMDFPKVDFGDAPSRLGLNVNGK
jgi:hypothetical protein